MGKFRTSRNVLRGERCYRMGYCDLKALFQAAGIDPIGYACGVYGWNYDVYRFETEDRPVYITTGYRGMVGDPIPHELIKKYGRLYDELNYKWEKIDPTNFGEFEIFFRTRRNEFKTLVDSFIAEVVL